MNTAAVRARLIERDGFKCKVCRVKLTVPGDPQLASKPTDASIDHIIPKSKGGVSADYNLRLLCYKCNTTRGNKMPERDVNLSFSFGRASFSFDITSTNVSARIEIK